MPTPISDLTWNNGGSDLIDWTITAAPDPAETELGGPAPTPAPVPIIFPRRLWVVAIGTVFFTLLGLWSIPALTWYRTQLTLRHIIALADVPSELPAPTAPLRALRWQPNSAHVQTLTALNSDLVRAEIARQFMAPSGETYTFISTEFYRFANDAWERTPTPDGYWGEPLHDQRGQIHWSYYAADAKYVNALASRMTEILDRVCDNWACPSQTFITLNLTGRGPRFAETLDITPTDPFLFTASPPHLKRWPAYTLVWPAPHAWGRPADDATTAFLERAYATQLLFTLADWQVFHQRIDAVGNVFFYALVIRLSAEVGLDSEMWSAATGPLPKSAYTLDELWNTRFSVWNRFDAIRTALALTNSLLHDQPPDAARALFLNLDAPDMVTWVARGLKVSEAEAHERLEWAFQSIQVWPIH